MPNALYTYILNIYDLVWLGFIAYQPLEVIECQISLYIYIKYIGFGLVWFGLVLWHINLCRLFNAKSSLYIYTLNIYDLVCFGFMAYQPLQVI